MLFDFGPLWSLPPFQKPEKETLLIDKPDTLNQSWKRGRTKELNPRQYYFKTRFHRKYLWNEVEWQLLLFKSISKDNFCIPFLYFQMSFWFCLLQIQRADDYQIFINYLPICGDVPRFSSFLWIPRCFVVPWKVQRFSPFVGAVLGFPRSMGAPHSSCIIWYSHHGYAGGPGYRQPKVI